MRSCGPSPTRSCPSSSLGLPASVSQFAELPTRPPAGHRAHRLGQVDDPGVAGRHHQPDQAGPHHDRGGPDRVPPPPQDGGGQPAGGGGGHAVLRQGAQARPPPGPRRDPGGRDARPRDHPHRAHGGGDGPPGLRDPPHPGRPAVDRPDHRRVPRPPAAAGAGAAGVGPPGGGHAAAGAEDRTAGAGWSPPRCWSPPRRCGTSSARARPTRSTRPCRPAGSTACRPWTSRWPATCRPDEITFETAIERCANAEDLRRLSGR